MDSSTGAKGRLCQPADITQRLDRPCPAVEQRRGKSIGTDLGRGFFRVEETNCCPARKPLFGPLFELFDSVHANRTMQGAVAFEFAIDLVPVNKVEHRLGCISEQFQKTFAMNCPKTPGRSLGMTHMPALTRPTLRPEPPNPISTASTTATFVPASAKCRAADNPVKPAPMTATSTEISPCNRSVFGAGGAVFSHRPWERSSFSMGSPSWVGPAATGASSQLSL